MGLLRRKTPEEKAAADAERQARKVALRAQWDDAMEKGRDEREAQKANLLEGRMEKISSSLQPDETIEAELRTAEKLMKKDLVLTSRRLIIGLATSKDFESIPYRAITAVRSGQFITKDIHLTVTGRRDTLTLMFEEESDRDRALEVLNRFAF